MTDCIIIGSGLAGISAALTLKANGKNFLLFGKKQLSDKIVKAESIRNYPGLFNVSGQAFCEALQSQLKKEEIEIKTEKVSGVYAMKEKFTVTTQEGGMYESASVILACGVESVKPIEGEIEFLGRGVSYCATCDGFLYKNKKLGVICTNGEMEHEVEYLAELASEVYLVALYKNVTIKKDNVTVIKKMPRKIVGEKRVESMSFASAPTETLPADLPIDGVFILKDSAPSSVLVGGLETENGLVKVGVGMATNIVGCYAAGDCTGRPYQYTKAAGEGNIAAHSVTEYLRNLQK